ncbi:universal stress protein [Georgenia daeguensis]|uniref:Universal stress protein n=1 Tax=Georgenia daeguensis TaxID=908355 RepID=A0ABP8EVC4_9MICO
MAARLDVPGRAVVVGADGSGRSRRAVEWAAGEAERRGAPLLLVCAVAWQVMAEGGVAPPSEDDLLGPARRVVEEELGRVRATHPGVTVTGAAVSGRPAVVLVEASERAGLVVVGAAGHRPVAGPLLGSVSQKVVAHAHGPVAVVREEAPAQMTGPVVVGADPSDPPLETLRFAFDEARRRGVGVVVVCATERARTTHSYSPVVSEFFAAQAEEDLESLTRTVDEMALERGVDAEVRRLAGHPADALIEVAGNRSLVVVGSRGHFGLTGLLLGSVSREVLQRAPAVVVVRERPRE